jgi:hypothetical protein
MLLHPTKQFSGAGDDLRINGIYTIDNNVLTDNVAYGTWVILRFLTRRLL